MTDQFQVFTFEFATLEHRVELVQDLDYGVAISETIFKDFVGVQLKREAKFAAID